jgi:hypothetical protein
MKNQIGISQELIQFQLDVNFQYRDTAPKLTVYINDVCKFDQTLSGSQAVISFDHLLDFGQTYELKIVRSAKTDQDPSQMLIINCITIDGVNVQNLIWSSSYYEPEYPAVWYQQQIELGQTPEPRITGETWLGHNGTWSMPFDSPFWRYLMEVMN